MAFNTYDVGDKVRVTVNFTDNGSPIDPTTVVFKWKSPAGTITTKTYGTDVEVVKTSTGVYYSDITPASAGKYDYRFAGTGAVVAASEGLFYVRPSEF
jgi:hypothetical protein